VILETLEFKFDGYRIMSPRNYFQFLAETFILDVYRTTELLRKNDLVLDLGATIGDFSVLASKKVGREGKVIAIEPNTEDYKLLKLNIKNNNCPNVVPINIGIGSEPGEKEISFWGRKFRCKLDTLENILRESNITDKINFIKMDIEGFEAEVVSENIQTFNEVDVISLEFHGTKQRLDELLLPKGFSFKPITMRYVYRKLLKHLLLHPIGFSRSFRYVINDIPRVFRTMFTGFDMARSDYLLTGSYVKDR
jgi:hypothetical protein